MSEETYFDQSVLWGRPVEPYQVQVQADLASLIPEDVRSILDAGCGDGLLTNALPGGCKVVGIDRSRESLKHVSRTRVRGSVTRLPFCDSSFDLVMCNDVLEHLSDTDFRLAVAELCRVAARFVVVTVPYAEQLEASFSRCHSCGHVGHVNGHRRSFSHRDLVGLMPSPWKSVEIRFSGDFTAPMPDPTISIRHRANQYFRWPHAVCERCGARDSDTPGGQGGALRVLDCLRSLVWYGEQQVITQWLGRSEIMCLYAKDAASSLPRQGGLPESSESILKVDFANPAQRITTDFSPGMAWARYVLPRGTQESAEGVTRAPGAAEPTVVPVRLPVSSLTGCTLSLSARHLGGGGRVLVSLVDGLLLKEHILLDVEASSTWETYEFPVGEMAFPDRFGLALSVHLFGRAQVRQLGIAPRAAEAYNRSFLHLSPGHCVQVIEEGSPVISWGCVCKQAGLMPKPVLPNAREDVVQSGSFKAMGDALSMKAGVDDHEWLQLFAFQTLIDSISHLSVELSESRHELAKRMGIKGAIRELCRGTGIQVRRFLPLRTLPAPVYPPPWRAISKMPTVRADGPLRVLVLSHMFPHPESPGLGSFVLEQVKGLHEHEGLDVRVLAGWPYWISMRGLLTAQFLYGRFHALHPWVMLDGVLVRFLPYRLGWWYRPTGVSYQKALCRGIDSLYREFPFQLIHAHTSYLDGSAARVISQRVGVPVVITEHTGPFQSLVSNPVRRFLTERALNHAERVIAVSEAQRQAILPHMQSARRERVVVLPNGTNCQLFKPPSGWRPDPAAPRLLFAGYFSPVKNLPVLIEAFSLVRREVPGANLTMVGRGETAVDDEVLRKDIERWGLGDAVRLLGYQCRERLAVLMREECDLLVLSSQSETFGCVLTEALACGKPVVATRCGGPEDIVTRPELGVLCPPRDPRALAHAILEAIRRLRDFDPAAIRRYAEQHFSQAELARGLTQLYRGVLGRTQ